MILPTVRASFGRGEALQLVELLGRHDPELRDAARARLDESGLDSLLDDPRVLNALLTEPSVKVPPSVIFYALARQALLEGGIDNARVADFVASLLVAFGQTRRAYQLSDTDPEEFHYLVDIVLGLAAAEEQRAFLLRSHMGNLSLWLSGLFPDFIEGRMRRKGGPPLDYYERMGIAGYRMAAESPQAGRMGVESLYRDVSREFTGVRHALNRISDRYLWPAAGDPVARVLREVVGRVGP
jgi:hypothetical protein